MVLAPEVVLRPLRLGGPASPKDYRSPIRASVRGVQRLALILRNAWTVVIGVVSIVALLSLAYVVLRAFVF